MGGGRGHGRRGAIGRWWRPLQRPLVPRFLQQRQDLPQVTLSRIPFLKYKDSLRVATTEMLEFLSAFRCIVNINAPSKSAPWGLSWMLCCALSDSQTHVSAVQHGIIITASPMRMPAIAVLFDTAHQITFLQRPGIHLLLIHTTSIVLIGCLCH